MLTNKISVKAICGVIICLAIVFGAKAQTNATWQVLTNEVANSRIQLNTLVAQASAAGLTTNYAYASQVVLNRFQTYAQYDYNNPSAVLNNLKSQYWYSTLNTNYSLQLPFDEMQECLEVASNAISEFDQQLNSNIVLKAPPNLSAGIMSLTTNHYSLNGVPVFPSSFTWMPMDADVLNAFGRIGGSYYDVSDLTSGGGSVTSYSITSSQNTLHTQSLTDIVPQEIFLGHANIPGWMTTSYPFITIGARKFTQYDTDSPLVRGWLDVLFHGYLPPVCGPTGSGSQPRIHLLANEPDWATRTGGWLANNGVSTNTMNKYGAWLEAKYGTIGALNATYGSAYATFAAAQAGMTMPISTGRQGGPVWYDWCRFNMDRINGWFSFLKAGVQSNDPAASPVTIKSLGTELVSPWRDDGIDMEFLANLQDVPGADLVTTPQGMQNINIGTSLAWTNSYALDWRIQSMTLDFYKSLCPDKAYFDSEWHGLSGGWIDLSMDRHYVRAALWLGFIHGMGAIQAWVWGRNDDGSFSASAGSIAGQLLSQPTVLDAFGRTLKELNAHASEATDLVNQSRNFMIYYCEEAAIQNASYVPQMTDLYEALKLLNLRVGFCTPSTVVTLSTASQTVIVPPTTFISSNSLAALQTFSLAGGHIVTVNGTTQSFLETELGQTRSGGPGFTPYASVTYGAVTNMANALASALAPLVPASPVIVGITDTNGNSAYGALVKEAVDPQSGNVIVSLINVSKDSRMVSLQTPGKLTRFRNLITQQTVGANITMAPDDVLLLQTEKARPVITTVTMSGSNVVISGTNAVVGSQYNLLTSTNIGLPLSQWAVLPTTIFSAEDFSMTNPVSPGLPQSFYILRMP